jgi:drug/metabolite transporter (DMT)-like permease
VRVHWCGRSCRAPVRDGARAPLARYDRAITSRQPLLTLAAYVTVALCWSGSWTAGKLGVAAIPPIELSTIRFALAGILMLVVARATGASLGLTKLPLVIVAGAFGVFGYNALVFVALTIAPASDGALIVPTINPVLTVLFASFIGERLTTNKLIGLAIATVGAAVVIGAATGLTFTGQRLVGDLLMLGGAACWSVYAILGAITTRHGSPLGVTAIACLAGAAMLFPLGFLEHGYADVPSWPFGAWLDIAYLVVFSTTIGFVLFYWAVRRFGAGLASMVSYLVPIFALIQAVTILGERPSPLEIVGGAIILVGVRVATLRFTPETPLEEAVPA